MPATGPLTLFGQATGIALVIAATVSRLPAPAAEPAGYKAPPKPIVRNLKSQTPLPVYSRPRGSGTVPRGMAADPSAGGAATSALRGASDRSSDPKSSSNQTRWTSDSGSAGILPASKRAGRPRSQATFVAPESNRGARPAYRLKAPLEGGVVMNVPKTPEDVAAYLQHMRTIIHDYEKVAVDTLLGGGTLNINPATIETSRGHSLEVIQRIRVTTPPAELTVAHNQLAETMVAVGEFLERPGGAAGGGLTALTQLQPLLSRLHGSLNRYHSGVRNCIAFYGLSPDLDPFNGEDEDAKQRLSGALSGMKNSLINPPAPGAPSASSPARGPMAGFGGSPQGGLGGIDLNALQGLLGGADLGALLGGSGNGDPSALGGAAGLDFSKSGAMDRLGNLDANSLGNLSGKELDVLKQFMGGANSGDSSSPGLQLDGNSADMLINTLKQLQGQ